MSRRNGTIKPTVNGNGSLCFHFKLTLVPGRDDDLIAALQFTPHGKISGKVREMMRGGISSRKFLCKEETTEISVDMSGVGMDL